MMALVTFGIALVACLVLVPVVRRFCLRHGYVAQPRDDRWHRKPTPVLGGLAIFLAFVISVAASILISGEQIESIKMILPKHELIEKYQQLCESNFDLILNLGYKNRILRQTRDLLLPKLISGKIDVSELDIKVDEIS